MDPNQLRVEKMSEALPSMSVIVVSYNRAEDLRLCLTAVFQSGYPSLEVIVVDNASTDEAPLVAESFKGVRLIRNSRNAGFAEANNQGFAVAGGKYIALMNNDAVVAPDYFHKMATFLEARPDCAAAGGKAYYWDEANPVGNRNNRYYAYTLIDARTGRNQAVADAPDHVHEVATLSGCAVVLRRQAIDDVGGGFLDGFFFAYYEETDFFARALRRGWKLYYLGEPAVWHRVRASTAAIPYVYYYHMDRNRYLYVWRNFDPPDLDVAKQAFEKAIRRHPFRYWLPLNAKRRARRDAWRWYLKNGQFLEEQRESLSGLPWTYSRRIREIQAPLTYYHHSRPEIVELVPADARRIVDVGCGAGCLGASIKRARAAVEVRGVEIVPEAAQAARQVLDDAVVARAEDDPPTHWPQPDCVIFADVLEHLNDPWGVLQSWVGRLKPGGCVVASLPNVAHHSVLRALIAGRWEYQEAGILDRTHLRFFTRSSVVRLMESGNLAVVAVKRVLSCRIGHWARKAARREPLQGFSGWRRFLLDACTVQYLVVARRKDGSA
jgi:GT2 family glycosyltransferase